MRVLKRSEVAAATLALKKAQGNVCAICQKPFTEKDRPCLDHDHTTGYVRGVLHLSCNGTEGKIKVKAMRGHTGVSAYDYLIGLGKYLEKHKTPQTKCIHPSHMDEDAKRERRNKLARKRRAAKKTEAEK